MPMCWSVKAVKQKTSNQEKGKCVLGMLSPSNWSSFLFLHMKEEIRRKHTVHFLLYVCWSVHMLCVHVVSNKNNQRCSWRLKSGFNIFLLHYRSKAGLYLRSADDVTPEELFLENGLRKTGEGFFFLSFFFPAHFLEHYYYSEPFSCACSSLSAFNLIVLVNLENLWATDCFHKAKFVRQQTHTHTQSTYCTEEFPVWFHNYMIRVVYHLKWATAY